MSVARVRSVGVIGVEGHLVDVEADLSPGLPGMSIVGLADTAVGESRDRARAAVHNSGLTWPQHRITIGLSPASLRKRGTMLDLAIVVAVLAAAGTVPRDEVSSAVLVGELGLDGRVRAVRGVLVAALTAVHAGVERMFVPAGNRGEACLVPGLDVVPVTSLRELVARLRGGAIADAGLDVASAVADAGDQGAHQHADAPTGSGTASLLPGGEAGPAPDLADVRGHAMARLALEIAAAGAHHVAMVGAPGVGKTMLATRLPGLLPDLGREDALEVTAIHSVAGHLPDTGLVTRPPMRAPHHRATHAAMVGGGSAGRVTLGQVSLAHRGVLFMDEAPEFAPSVLDALREPLEHGAVEVARAGVAVRLPARFLLVMAANPCPCGLAGQPVAGPGPSCSCSPVQRRRYLARLSGPLLDRIDIRLNVERPTAADLAFDDCRGDPSAVVASRVVGARARAARRLRATPWRTNGEVPGPVLRRRFPPAPDAAEVLNRLAADPHRSARGVDRVARVAWTVADLAGHERPVADDVWRAIGLRDSEDRWAA